MINIECGINLSDDRLLGLQKVKLLFLPPLSKSSVIISVTRTLGLTESLILSLLPELSPPSECLKAADQQARNMEV